MNPKAAWSPLRRRLVGLLRAAGLAACARAPPRRLTAEDSSGFRIAAEFEPLRAAWIGYDAGHADFTAALVAALLPQVKLKLMVNSDEGIARARAGLRQRGVNADNIQFIVEPLAIFYLRDAAVFAVGPGGQLGVVDFKWSAYGLPGWCWRRHADNLWRASECATGTDTRRDALDRQLADAAGAQVLESSLAVEGGGIEVNGRGTIIANEALLTQRNPGRSRDELERELLQLPGLRKVLWLPHGLAQDPQLRATIVGKHVAWGTGGHTDEFVRFADARTVLLAWPDDAEVASGHPVARLNRERMQRNHEVLASATDQDGQRLRVVKLPLPRVIERRVVLSAKADGAVSGDWSAEYFPASENRREGDALMQVASASYLNFVIANGVVLVPDYLKHGTPRTVQDQVRRLLEDVFPGRRILFIDAIGLNWVGGGPHCTTLAEPAAEA